MSRGKAAGCGFLWGFGIVAVPSIALLCYGAFTSGGPGFCSMGQAVALMAGGIGLVIAVGTGLLGTLIGYLASREAGSFDEHLRGGDQQ